MECMADSKGMVFKSILFWNFALKATVLKRHSKEHRYMRYSFWNKGGRRHLKGVYIPKNRAIGTVIFGKGSL